MAEDDQRPPGARRVFRIYVSRDQGLHALPADYEDIEQAKCAFETHHGQFQWCLIGEVEPATERPVFLLHGVVFGSEVEWRRVP